MNWLGLAGAAAALALSVEASAQELAAEGAPPPAEPVCLTNACGPAPKAAAIPRTVGDAIAGGQAFRVRDLGGSPVQAMEAILQRLKARPPASEDQRRQYGGFETPFHQFADLSDGSSLQFSDNADYPGPTEFKILGSIEKSRPDGSVERLYLTDNGGGIWVRPGFERPRG